MNIIDLLIKYCLPSENFSYKQYDESFLKVMIIYNTMPQMLLLQNVFE